MLLSPASQRPRIKGQAQRVEVSAKATQLVRAVTGTEAQIPVFLPLPPTYVPSLPLSSTQGGLRESGEGRCWSPKHTGGFVAVGAGEARPVHGGGSAGIERCYLQTAAPAPAEVTRLPGDCCHSVADDHICAVWPQAGTLRIAH